MVRRKVEGDETERRKKARQARARGSSPSAEQTTTGASKQPRSLPKRDRHHHRERLESIHRGKQAESPEPKPGYRVPASKRRKNR
jgi:hypothetical protein